MLTVYSLCATGLKRLDRDADAPLPEEAVWLDLLEPTVEEERLVEARLGVDVPTREEMREIETSNRLYEEAGGLYLTATIVTKLDTMLPENAQVTFILKGPRLVTNRYVDTLPFRRFAALHRAAPAGQHHRAGSAGRIARIHRQPHRRCHRACQFRHGHGLDGSVRPQDPALAAQGDRATTSASCWRRIGQSGELISKARESLVSLSRLVVFVQQSTIPVPQEVRTRLRTLSKDVVAMSDHASFLGSNLNFMLDATLGMINIDQNNILKIFSVATVVLLPPSVIGAIFGMNFDKIPTAHEPWGFYGALVLMVALGHHPVPGLQDARLAIG